MFRYSSVLGLIFIMALCAPSLAVLTVQPSSPSGLPNRNLVAHWTLNNGAGDIAFDKSDFQNDAALSCTGHDCAVPQWLNGGGSPGMRFDGEDDYLWVRLSSSLRPRDSTYTVSAWVKPDRALSLRTDKDDGDSATIISADWDFWDLSFNRWDGWRFEWGIPNTDRSWTAHKKVNAAANTWYHLVGVRNPEGLKLFVNGQPSKNKADINEWQQHDVNYPINIGSFMHQKSFFPGTISEIRIYNRALSAEEVLELFNLAELSKHSNLAPFTAMVQ